MSMMEPVSHKARTVNKASSPPTYYVEARGRTPKRHYGKMALFAIAFIVTAPVSVPLAAIVGGMIAAAIASDRRLIARMA